MKFNKLTLILLAACTACQKPPPIQPAPEPPVQEAGADTLRVTGYYDPQSCTAFFDARLTPSGTLLHDDTMDPADCNDKSLPFYLQTFRFPITGQADLQGLRIELLGPGLPAWSNYHFTTAGFRLSTPTHPDYEQQAAYLYAFATPGKQVLQAFFSEADWQELLSSADQLDVSFQLVSGKGPDPNFTLLRGRYDMQDRILHIDNEPDWETSTPKFQFQLLDSFHVLRIRSCYTLLTEDFAMWDGDNDCRPLQNWDVRLIPADGYNLLEVKIDPPFLECIREGPDQTLHFRVALLR